MPEFHVPPEVREGDHFDLTGSGFQEYGPFIRVNVTYLNRAETMKVRVADQATVAQDPSFSVGDIALDLYVDQPGDVDIVLWTYDQRDQLASAHIVVTPRG